MLLFVWKFYQCIHSSQFLINVTICMIKERLSSWSKIYHTVQTTVFPRCGYIIQTLILIGLSMNVLPTSYLGASGMSVFSQFSVMKIGTPKIFQVLNQTLPHSLQYSFFEEDVCSRGFGSQPHGVDLRWDMLLFRSRESRKFVITVECRRVESVFISLDIQQIISRK